MDQGYFLVFFSYTWFMMRDSVVALLYTFRCIKSRVGCFILLFILIFGGKPGSVL